MPFAKRIAKVSFAKMTGIPQTFMENGKELTYVPPQRDVEGTGFYMPTVEPTPATVGVPAPRMGSRMERMGYWSHTSGRKNVPGLEASPPTRMQGWTWTLNRVPEGIAFVAPQPILIAPRRATKLPRKFFVPDDYTAPPSRMGQVYSTPLDQEVERRMEAEGFKPGDKGFSARYRAIRYELKSQFSQRPLIEPSPLIGPDQFTAPPPPEIQRYERLPDTPPPGPAVPPLGPMWDALRRSIEEMKMAPGPAPQVVPRFVEPGPRVFTDAQPGAVVMAGMDIKKLIVPLALLATAFVVLR